MYMYREYYILYNKHNTYCTIGEAQWTMKHAIMKILNIHAHCLVD